MAKGKVTSKKSGSKGMPKVPTSASKASGAINGTYGHTKGKAKKKPNQVGGPSTP